MKESLLRAIHVPTGIILDQSVYRKKTEQRKWFNITSPNITKTVDEQGGHADEKPTMSFYNISLFFYPYSIFTHVNL